ncbi:polycystic kidney disease protein 1-like 2 [Hyalella azteca]|uniref:Polycystic kidney disease protein 1-like 2 n=1 Tax=Hyalella azteca TaxID=294128 RepID=A0A979FI85_HYAAZ|nr:polycystic kidney disease protein 1-like 2 [Hyalella azteca]
MRDLAEDFVINLDIAPHLVPPPVQVGAMCDLAEEFVINLDIAPHLVPPLVQVEPLVNRRNLTWGVTHSIHITDDDSAIYFVLTPSNATSVYDVFLGFEEQPTESSSNMSFTVPHELLDEDVAAGVLPMAEEELRHSVLIPSQELYGKGVYLLLVQERVNISFDYEMPAYEDVTGTRPPAPTPPAADAEDFLFGDAAVKAALDVQPWYADTPTVDDLRLNNYSMQLVAPSCRYWDAEREVWDTTGCRVGYGTTLNRVRCFCNHLTSFGSDFFVPPNTIDFSAAFSDLGGKLADNYAVLLTICILLGAYVILGVWARYKDRQDVKKWGVTPLEDNLESEKFLYLITVSTGMQAKSGTSSNIFFSVAGDKDQTGVRKLSDGKRKYLSRSSQVRYVVTTERPLGRLQTLRVWHDNSGKGDDASWFLERITVSDLQTGRTFAFLVNQWLAVDEDDGQISRLVSVASPQDLTAFANLFASTSKKNFTDGHLWISVFVRPYQSTYTRLQRLSVVVSVTFLTMVVNAMFYETEPPNSAKFELGFVTITSFQIWVSIMGTVIVLPPSILMDQIFRKARPKPSKTDPLMQKVAQQQEHLQQKISNGNGGENIGEDYDPGYTSSEIDSDDDEVTRSKKLLRKKMKKKNKKTFPWWTVFVAWGLVLAAIGASAFFVFSYSMQWGKDKSNSWLISMSLSVFQSVMIVQPLKVLLLAAVAAILLKKPDVEDLTEEERRINGLPAEDEDLVVAMPGKGTRQRIEMKPVNSKKLEKLRLKRKQENEMLSLIKQILIYAIYLIFLLFLAQQNRNFNAFLINDNMKKMFVDYDSDSYERYMQPADLLTYLNETFVPNAYWTEEYNGDLVTWRNAPFMSDMASFRIGAVRLRQLRVMPDQCQTQSEMGNVSKHCNVEYSDDTEDRGRYRAGWLPNAGSPTPFNSPWAYRTMGQLKGAPVVGRLNTYGGGGFVVDLVGSKLQVDVIVEHLKQKAWLDKYTRAVFIELGVVNVYVNLFTRVCLLTEFSNTGLALSSYQITSFQLYSYVGAGAAWIVFCEVAVLVFIVIFLVRVSRSIKKVGKSFFRSFWNVMELVKVALSITAVVMYAMKNAYVALSLGDIANRSGEFMNFQRLALWNETFIYLIAFVCFISILECLNLLRFNVRMSMLARTLRTCSTDLAAFSFTFFITFMAFVQFAYIAFSANMQIYKGFVTTMESMVGHLLGSIDMKEMLHQNGYFGVIFYLVFILLMSFIVLNMFFSIMGEAFASTKEEIAKEKNQYELLAFMTGLVYDLMGWKNKPKLITDFDEDDVLDDGEDDQDELSDVRKEKSPQNEGTTEAAKLNEADDELTPAEGTLPEAPPVASYLEPPKIDPRKLPPLRLPSSLPVSNKPPPASYLLSVPSSRPEKQSPLQEAPPSPGTPIYTFPDGSWRPRPPSPPAAADAPLPPPLVYQPPPEEEVPVPSAGLSDRPMDFMKLAPLPDIKTLYGNAWYRYFTHAVLQPFSAVSPVVPEPPQPLPHIETEAVLCRLDQVEAQLDALMDDECEVPGPLRDD